MSFSGYVRTHIGYKTKVADLMETWATIQLPTHGFIYIQAATTDGGKITVWPSTYFYTKSIGSKIHTRERIYAPQLQNVCPEYNTKTHLPSF